LQINVSKNNTIHSLLQKQFPAIKSSDNKPTYYVTPKTIGYIHGIVTDCIKRLPSDACNQCALRNEIMILEVLEAQEPAVFRHQLFNTLMKYYEEIQSMSGAGGRPKPIHFKHTMIADEVAAAAAAGRRRRSSSQSGHFPRQESGKRACRSGWGKGTVVNKPA
jgi:hypothetical protein